MDEELLLYYYEYDWHLSNNYVRKIFITDGISDRLELVVIYRYIIILVICSFFLKVRLVGTDFNVFIINFSDIKKSDYIDYFILTIYEQ